MEFGSATRAHSDDPLGTNLDNEDPIRQALATGDVTTAFTRLLELYADGFYGFVRHMVGDDDAAEEIWQGVLVEAFGKITRAPGELSLRAWLYSLAPKPILKKIAEMDHQKAQFAPSYEPRPYVSGPLGDDKLVEELERATQRLKDPLRLALLLRMQEKFSYKEMEAICDESSVELRKKVAAAIMVTRLHLDRGSNLS